MTRHTITLFGNFGTQNLGNEYTLRAILENLRERLPDARFNCVCPDPEDAAARHQMPALLMSYRCSKMFKSSGARSGRLIRFLRRFFIRLPLELLEWFKAFRALKGTRMLVMTGTGMLGDLGIGALDLHYEILKWSIIAKLRGSRLLFVSVGAGPIADPLSRWIVKRALALADYRSYRDAFSKEYLARIGFDSRRDPVYPDLGFSLKPSVSPGVRDPGPNRRIVGVGLMDYYGTNSSPERGERAYRRYVERMAAFAAWLVERGYAVQLFIGDLAYDTRVVGDVRRILQERATGGRGEILQASIASVEQLLEHLAKTDLVVATRFHNILLALMLNKPVVAVSYHEKIASLMSVVGLVEYYQDVDALEVEGLVDRFTRLEQNAGAVRSLVARRAEECRTALDEQYARISGIFRSDGPRP
jgi:polysaccharide pyruvyl transferase WcaK-like protein